MSTLSLLGIAIVAVVVLLFLVIRVQLSAFVSLLLVSVGTALAAGIPVAKVVPTMVDGMGKTLGSVMIVVGLGAMLGKIVEVAGGADSLATSFTEKLGQKRVIAAVTIAAFILGIPVFFDVAFIVIAPIVFGFAKVAKINPLKIGLPVAAVLLSVHVAMPPHPGPVAAAGILGVDAGQMIIFALPLCAISGIVGFFLVKKIKVDHINLLDSPAASALASTETPGGDRPAPPKAWIVCAVILLPIIQIMAGTTGTMLTEKDSTAYNILSLIGASAFALLTAVIVAYLVIGRQQRWNLAERGQILDSALPAVAVIVFVTGAGGVFASVLVASGIGTALSQTLINTHLPIIATAYLLTAALRASQGSATVAILTTAGLLAEPIAAAGYTPIQATLVCIALGFGGLGYSHINDSGFWIVTKYLGLSVKDGLKTWTVASTIFSILGFLFTWGAFAAASAI